MRKARLFVAIGLFLAFASTTAMAVEPAYRGQFGNPEEPATRPYKWLYRGVKSFFYHTFTAFKRGNFDKVYIVGTVETTRGIRTGAVELHSSVWKGMMGSQVRHYKVTGATNRIIDNDWALRNMADFAASVATVGALTNGKPFITGSDVRMGVAIHASQQTLDDVIPAKEWRPVRESARTRVRRAQTAYIGDRASENDKVAQGRGNLLKLGR